MGEGWSSRVSFLGSPTLSPHFKGGGTALVAGRECEDECSRPEMLQMAAAPSSHFPGCETPLGITEKEGGAAISFPPPLHQLPAATSVVQLHQWGQALPQGDEPGVSIPQLRSGGTGSEVMVLLMPPNPPNK